MALSDDAEVILAVVHRMGYDMAGMDNLTTKTRMRRPVIGEIIRTLIGVGLVEVVNRNQNYFFNITTAGLRQVRERLDRPVDNRRIEKRLTELGFPPVTNRRTT
ncbi:hypothetical protein BC739_003152 [Kutzneria viridogrisea]|uniref:MarR family transcriptional regulator n=1 Tax=Kutzneria viridogrisea TaxID=47990 RepID=A0ABR6BGF6_9PSEU|nr:hypothetical protein [Kutzneria viridogrisea]